MIRQRAIQIESKKDRYKARKTDRKQERQIESKKYRQEQID